MAREYEDKGKIEVTPKVDPDYIKQTRAYKLITPLFGGGAEPQKPDAITTVRGSEVRGHLRFWWRATRGGRYDGDLAKMKKAEEEIWGSAAQKGKAGPSKVKINVKVLNSGKNDAPFEVIANRDGMPQVKARAGSKGHPYATFPLQPNQNDGLLFGMETASVQNDVTFILELSYKKENENHKDIDAALWAWETFGGIGGRTRRGFGALECTMIDNIPVKPPDYESMADAIKKGLEKHVIANGNWYSGVPYLSLDEGNYKLGSYAS